MQTAPSCCLIHSFNHSFTAAAAAAATTTAAAAAAAAATTTTTTAAATTTTTTTTTTTGQTFPSAAHGHGPQFDQPSYYCVIIKTAAVFKQ